MAKRKTAEEVAAIDAFLKENYPVNGAHWCAKELGESLQYVRCRAHKFGLYDLVVDDHRRKTQGSEIVSLRMALDQCSRDNDVLRKRNKELRKSSLVLAHKVKKLESRLKDLGNSSL